MKIVFQVYTNINKLIVQMKDLPTKDRIIIGATLFFWLSCAAWALAIPAIVIIHMVR